nr:Rieske 2Fe-2S domain-containing protein [uncultured Dongia sp.]
MTGYRFLRLAAADDEIWCGDRRAFRLAPPGERPMIVNGRCPHRGGPLALGDFDCVRRELRCPWHGQRHGLARLQAGALPAIRIGRTWLVALAGAPSDAEAICFHRDAPAAIAAPSPGK